MIKEEEIESADNELAMQVLFAVYDPWSSNWHAAMKHSDAEEWENAAQVEIDSHTVNGTLKSCPLPPGKKAIGSRWVFVQKLLTNGQCLRYSSSQKVVLWIEASRTNVEQDSPCYTAGAWLQSVKV